MQLPESSFLDAIHDRPDDSGLRLIYADFLDEYGDPRSDLLRKEVLAAEILGRQNVHGILDAQAFYGKIEPEILQQLTKAPFPSTEILEESCGHLLVLSPGHSLIQTQLIADQLDIDQSARREARKMFFLNQDWYFDNQERFASTRHTPQWLLLPKQPLEDLCSRTFPEQQREIEGRYPEYRILRASEFAYALVLHEHATGERLLTEHWLRSADMTSRGELVSVGLFSRYGVRVDSDRSVDASRGIGVAIARKF